MKPVLVVLFFCAFCTSAFAQGKTTIFTQDIDNFWTAYDSVKTTTDTARQRMFIQHLYLDKASDGLKDFMIARQHTAKRHLYNILQYPRFWVSVRPHTIAINSFTENIDGLMQRFGKLYKGFKRPDVFFTIGCLNSGGTTTKDKILIGSEIAASDSSVDASELGGWLQGVFKLNTNVVYLVAHEVGHTQQQDAGNSNLLGYCIKEGACDFIAELLLGKPISSPYMNYGNNHEQELWQVFEKEMLGKVTKNWLYNGGQAASGKADLGYFIGYSICKSYYKNAQNKTKALKEIIELNYSKESAVEFLKKSKYSGGRVKAL